MINAREARQRSAACRENMLTKLEKIEELILSACAKGEQKLSILEVDLFSLVEAGKTGEKTPLMEAVAVELKKHGFNIEWRNSEIKRTHHLGGVGDDPEMMSYHMVLSW